MFRSDAHAQNMDNTLSNINNINVDIVSKIEKELEPYDLISMVFLLYENPHTALQKLIVFQRVSKDFKATNTNLQILYEWSIHAQTRSTWKYEFLEALAICQLNNSIRKLGLNVTIVKRHFLPNNIHSSVYLNVMKKALYKLCENMTMDNLVKLKNTLKAYNMDVMDHESCELVFLELMCAKFLTIEIKNDRRCTIMNLANIVQNLFGLNNFARELRDIEKMLNEKVKLTAEPGPNNAEYICSENNDNINSNTQDDHLDECFNLFNELCLDNSTLEKCTSDAKRLENAYPIKNVQRVGVCYIINQVDFHLPKESIEKNIQVTPLETRLGSDCDKKVLEESMKALSFDVISHRNLDHNKMLECIKNIIEYTVQYDDSMFMLCLLSHGVKGHVYAADSVKVKIEAIQNMIDNTFEQRNLEIPKIMIIQACQVNDDDDKPVKLVADAPKKFYLRKSHFLVYWATAPELEAFRDEGKGSLFILYLCHTIKKYAKHEHLYDIFTRVTDGVAKLCTKLQRYQVPIFETTLRKKLYLQVPE